MLVEYLLSGIEDIITAIMILLDLLPEVPPPLVESLGRFFNLVFDNLSLLGFVVRIETLKFIIPGYLIAMNASHVYEFVMWILRKVPFINIK